MKKLVVTLIGVVASAFVLSTGIARADCYTNCSNAGTSNGYFCSTNCD